MSHKKDSLAIIFLIAGIFAVSIVLGLNVEDPGPPVQVIMHKKALGSQTMEFSFSISMKQMKRISAFEWMILPDIPELAIGRVRHSAVYLFIEEDEKMVRSPVFHYHNRHAISLEFQYEKNQLCIRLFGNYYPGGDTVFRFRALLADSSVIARIGETNRYSYEEIKKVLAQ